jgi:hypothetical protein
MQIEDARLRELLAQMAAEFARSSALRQDLERECLIHLWRLEKEQPGQTKSWYLQSCRRELQHRRAGSL